MVMEGSLKDQFIAAYATLQNAEVVLTAVEVLYDALDDTDIHCFGEAGENHDAAVLAIAEAIVEDDGDAYEGLTGVVYYTTKDAEDLRDGHDFHLTLRAGPPGHPRPDEEARLAGIAKAVCERLVKLPFGVEWDGKHTVTINPNTAAAAGWLKARRECMFSVPA
jgi:hypothetical protein